LVLVFLLPLAGLPLGCRGRPDAVSPDGSVVQARLTGVYWLCRRFSQKRRQPPANAEELREFGANLPAIEGGPVVLTEEFLLSPRDRKPIQIRFGVRIPASSSRNADGGDDGAAAPKIEDGPVLAYEQDGFEGRRFVIYAGSGRVEEVNEVRFKELVP
jgi:hypothetical protein